MHVERGRVGENLAASLHGAEDVGPRLFAQLRDRRPHHLAGLRRLATPAAAGGRVAPVTGLGPPRRRGRVSLSTVHPASGSSSSAGSAAATHSPASRRARPKGCCPPTTSLPPTVRHIRQTCFRFSKQCASDRTYFKNCRLRLAVQQALIDIFGFYCYTAGVYFIIVDLAAK